MGLFGSLACCYRGLMCEDLVFRSSYQVSVELLPR